MNILVGGDSFSATSGFRDATGKVWHNHLSGTHTVVNVSVDGQSNYKIFTKIAYELLANRHQYHLVIIQWSGLFRITFNRGHSIHENTVICNIRGYSNEDLSDFYNVWTKNYLHGFIELTEFLTLKSTMATLLQSLKIPFIFIDTFDNFIKDIKNLNWKTCSDEYTNFILHKHELPDEEISQYHKKLHSLHQKFTELAIDNCLNPHINWTSQLIDHADDNIHPGIETHKNYYKEVVNFAKSKGINL